jgi:hypothetical protein
MKPGDAIQPGECGHIRPMDALSLNNNEVRKANVVLASTYCNLGLAAL